MLRYYLTQPADYFLFMQHTLRYWLYHALDKQKGNLLALLLNQFLMLMISLNVMAVLLESDLHLYQTYAKWFDGFEYFSIAVFTLEYLVRLWVCVESEQPHYQHPIKGRLRYAVSPMALIDLLAIVPFYLGFFFHAQDLRILRSLRLLRIIKLTRYSHSLNFLLQVLRQEAETMISALFVLSVLVLLAATGIYLVEGHINTQAFGSIPRSLWWATVSLTTVGYGDVVPQTILGKLFGGLILVCGIAVAALPAAILASGFIKELDKRREQFRTEVIKALNDGMISLDELHHLEHLRIEFGITHADSRQIFHNVHQMHRLHTYLNCPHCAKPLTIEHPPGYVHVKKAGRSQSR